MTDIILIQPPGWSVQNPPMGLALLKSYLSLKGFNARVMDLNIMMYNLRGGRYERAWEDANGYYTWERSSYVKDMYEDYSPEIFNFIYSALLHRPRVIGFSVHSSTAASVKLLAEKFRLIEPKIKLIFGGPQAIEGAGLWKELFAEDLAGGVVFGEGEETLAEYLAREEHNLPIKGMAIKTSTGEVLKGEPRELISPLDFLPFPDYSDFDLSLYEGKKVLPTYFSRGCINRCIYCTENKFFPHFRNRSGKRVFNEIMHQLSLYPWIKYFRMHDSVSNGNIRELENFCDLLIENEVRIGFNLENAVVRKEMTQQLYRKLKKAGCDIIGYGLENPSKRLLKYIGKQACLDADFDRVVEDGASGGFTIGVNMMFGLPGETEEDSLIQLDFLKKQHKNHRHIIINPALNFCYLPEGCEARKFPHKYSIDISGGEHFWSADSGANNFEIRMARFERFCSLAKKVGYENIFGVTKSLNKNEMLGRYWKFMGKPDKALEYFQRSFDTEEKTVELALEIIGICELLSKKNGTYNNIKTYLARPISDGTALWQSVKNRSELNIFIACFDNNKIKKRLKKYLSERPVPRFNFSLSGIKKRLRHSLEKLCIMKGKRKYVALLSKSLFLKNKTVAMKEMNENI